MKKMELRSACGVTAAVLLSISLAGNAFFYVKNRTLERGLQMQRQRELTDIADAMSDIEINLQKLLIVSGASQSVNLLLCTALLAQHVENGLSRLPLAMDTATDAMKFAGQMGDYALTLATQISGGGMLTQEDEIQLGGMLSACRSLNAYLEGSSDRIYDAPMNGEAPLPGNKQADVTYPTLIYDGPFSDGRLTAAPKGLTGERVTREQARAIAANAAGTTIDRVQDGWDSGGAFESFGFIAKTELGNLHVQITGQGGHLLWMMPEKAEFDARKDRESCLSAAKIWLADHGFGEMEPCFVQEYDGMLVVNFAAMQEGVLLYPDQVKVQVSMESGTVVGAECTQYLTYHEPRAALNPTLDETAARDMLSSKLKILSTRLCVIPGGGAERLCWGFEGTYQEAKYWVFIDAKSGETADILRVIDTAQGEAAV